LRQITLGSSILLPFMGRKGPVKRPGNGGLVAVDVRGALLTAPEVIGRIRRSPVDGDD
ncbi:hypothetical protein V2G26_014584, partial [Clonostachys chloroleuca]